MCTFAASLACVRKCVCSRVDSAARLCPAVVNWYLSGSASPSLCMCFGICVLHEFACVDVTRQSSDLPRHHHPG